MTAPVAPMEARHSVTPLEALRRLIAVAKWPDAHWFSSEADWNEFQTELAVAEMVVRDYVAPVAPQPEWDQEPIGTLARNSAQELLFTPLRDFHVTDGMRVFAVPQTAQKVEVGEQVPPGWKLVPEEPTAEMYRAAAKIDNEMFAGGSSHGAEDGQVWAAMYDAAPNSPQLEEQQAGDVARDSLMELLDSVLGNCYMGNDWELERATDLKNALMAKEKA